MSGHITDIALAATDRLAPYLPVLMNGAVTQIGKSFVEIAVKQLWEKLEPTLQAKDDARIAAEQVAAKPESEARRAVFQEELETLLRENPDVEKEIARIMAESNIETRINQLSTGNGVQTIGINNGKVFGNVAGNLTIHE
jgi:cobalamin biosynthesis Mg chelatase CobN